MYRIFVRPILFLFPPETIHRLVAAVLLTLFRIPGTSLIIRKIYRINHPKLERNLLGLRFPNPVGVAAGFDKTAKLYNALAHFGFGFVEIGTVTPVGQPGNPKPRLFRLPKDKALINRMGFNNDGVEAFVKNLRKRHPKVIIGGNIGKNTATPNEKAVHDYCHCFEALFDLVDYFVVNVSCPNIKGLSGLQDKERMLELLQSVQQINRTKPKQKPVLLKISPDLSEKQLDEVMEIVSATRLDGIIATNTSAQRNQIKTRNKKLEAIGQGGLSGSPLKHKSIHSIQYIHKKSKGRIPVIGVGGIFTANDALQALKAGASLVQVYTGFVYEGPSIAKRINKQILQNQ